AARQHRDTHQAPDSRPLACGPTVRGPHPIPTPGDVPTAHRPPRPALWGGRGGPQTFLPGRPLRSVVRASAGANHLLLHPLNGGHVGRLDTEDRPIAVDEVDELPDRLEVFRLHDALTGETAVDPELRHIGLLLVVVVLRDLPLRDDHADDPPRNPDK